MLTAEDFAGQKFDLPEGGRWSELIAGEITQLDPPSIDHGNAVLNVSKALAEWSTENPIGYACFELGLIVARNPDTVYCPPISYFVGGDRFAESDKSVTQTIPSMILEVVSTPDRRANTDVRTTDYLNWGVSLVWVIELKEQQVRLIQRETTDSVLSPEETIDFNKLDSAASSILPGFRIPVSEIFAEPEWWNPR